MASSQIVDFVKSKEKTRLDQLFHNPGLIHIGHQILNQVNKESKIQPKNVSQTWSQIVGFVQSNEKMSLMYFYSNFGKNHIGRKIFMELNFEGIQAARGVCKMWKDIIDDYQFWWEWNQIRDKKLEWNHDEDAYYISSSHARYGYLNFVLNSFKVFDFHQETRGLTKNAISFFCIRSMFLQKYQSEKFERNMGFYQDLWLKIAIRYLNMYKIQNLWAALLKIHSWKKVKKMPNELPFNSNFWQCESKSFLEKYLKKLEFDPLDDKIKSLNNLTNFCLNPNLKHIGQKIFSYLKFKDQVTSRRVCFSFKKAIDTIWAENVGLSMPKFNLRLSYSRNSARKLMKQIKSAQKSGQIAKKRSGCPIN